MAGGRGGSIMPRGSNMPRGMQLLTGAE